MSRQTGLWCQLSMGLLLLACPFEINSQTVPCGPKEMEAALPSDAPAYPDAISLSEQLGKHGISVRCLLRSKMEDTFQGQEGAALYRTDQGDFEALFLPPPKTFGQLKVIEWRDGRRCLYRFKGHPQPWSASLIDSAFRLYFVKNRNLLFVVQNSKQLSAILEKLGRSEQTLRESEGRGTRSFGWLSESWASPESSELTGMSPYHSSCPPVPTILRSHSGEPLLTIADFARRSTACASSTVVPMANEKSVSSRD